MITYNAAKMLQIDQYVGSIEPGKVADLVIYDKHPLSTMAKVQKVYIDGTQYFDRDKDLTDRVETGKKKTFLLEKEKANQPRPAAPKEPARRPNGGAF